jgi:hypothetical protein
MAVKRYLSCLARVAVVCLAAKGLLAHEHRGTVKSGAIAVPGATVTAIQGDKKVLTTSDDQGSYVFPDLADGVWTIRVEMLGFGPVSRDIGIGPDAPPADWQLKLQSMDEISSALAAKAAPAPTPAPPPATAQAAATTSPAPAAAPAATPARTAPAAPAAAPAAPKLPGALLVVIAFALLFVLAFVAPFLAGLQNPIGLLIIGIGLYEAWKMNKRPRLEITGPHLIADPEPAPEGATPDGGA